MEYTASDLPCCNDDRRSRDSFSYSSIAQMLYETYTALIHRSLSDSHSTHFRPPLAERRTLASAVPLRVARLLQRQRPAKMAEDDAQSSVASDTCRPPPFGRCSRARDESLFLSTSLRPPECSIEPSLCNVYSPRGHDYRFRERVTCRFWRTISTNFFCPRRRAGIRCLQVRFSAGLQGTRACLSMHFITIRISLVTFLDNLERGITATRLDYFRCDIQYSRTRRK